jgi:putative addiction module component (TIGR02574 family)
MTEAVRNLKHQMESLSQAERAELAYYLLTSLELEEEGAEEAWRVEINRRVDEIKSGKVVGRSAEEVFTELRERYP